MTHPFRKKNAKSIFLLCVAVLVSLLAFQNCGKGFKAGRRLYNRFRGLSTPLGNTSNRMPQLGSAIVDPIGQALLNDWIMRFNE